ncbi:siderophore-interacting protein [Kutzneria buriramensis]|uniref:NADPH-dependent ferric siderophore reductase n=1 Tax=Kutzneria buriramensis TaxID=1045776 RepID=A0A3E0HQA6_9PSEU|nr:siderophore-interacting protein [Kutzneria buriramensis]REH48607.1 NADPH-dependent ferric siderophore reductase [Kutzneria buriramensis]
MSTQYKLVTVTRVRQVSPRTRRLTFGGPELADFTSVAPDQQVKLFFGRNGEARPWVPQPPADGDTMRWYQAYLDVPEERRPWMRAYSVRAHRADDAEIDIDFLMHDVDGPATRWAAAAEPGDVVGLLGPTRSHLVTPGPYDWQLFAGDQSALPAIAASLAQLPVGAKALAYIEIADEREVQDLSSSAEIEVRWVHNGLLDAVRAAEFPDGAVYAWLAGEAYLVRSLRRHLVGDRGVPRHMIAFAGYWRVDATHDQL